MSISRLSKSFVRILLPLTLVYAATACTQDEPAVEDVVKAEPAAQPETKSEHDFEVGKDGKVVFKAEIVYFKFDDHTLTQEGMDRLNALADYLKSNPEQKLKIEGHCDERGSIEYNLSLGQRRSQSVRDYLANVGIAAARIDTVTFGEEKPAVAGSGEESWSKNRRAEFTLTGAQAE